MVSESTFTSAERLHVSPDPINVGAQHYLDYLRASMEASHEPLALWDEWRVGHSELTTKQALHRATHHWYHGNSRVA